MLPREIEEGNREYKRYLCGLTKFRFEGLLTQMKWRLREGDGIAYYYIGVDDDGSIYNLNRRQLKETINNMKSLIKKCNSKMKLELKTIQKQKYYLFTIKENKNKKYNEKRILLLGDTQVGKTTFLSYLIHNKLGNNSRMYVLNHKHEIETGKTSSFNYQHFIYKNNKYIFLDTPGDKIYNKTLNKILLSFDIDLILYFPKKNTNWYYYDLYMNYATFKKIPWIELNIYLDNNNLPNINMKNPIEQNKIIEYFESNILPKEKYIGDTKFNVLQTYPSMDLGIILSGYLKYGTLNINDYIYWNNYNFINNVNEINKLKIKSIYIDGKPYDSIQSNTTATICLENNNNKGKYGFLSDNKKDYINKINLKWLYKNNEIPITFNGYIENETLIIVKINNELYDYKTHYSCLLEKGNIMICIYNNFYGICILI